MASFSLVCPRVKSTRVKSAASQQPPRREGLSPPPRPGRTGGNQVQHLPDRTPRVVNTAARRSGGMVGGPQRARARPPGNPVNLALAEGVVPQGHHVAAPASSRSIAWSRVSPTPAAFSPFTTVKSGGLPTSGGDAGTAPDGLGRAPSPRRPLHQNVIQRASRLYNLMC